MKICPICGAENEDNRIICKECGFGMELEEDTQPVVQQQKVSYYKPKSKQGLALASLICGIIGLVLSCVVIGIIPSIIALILGIIALAQSEVKKEKVMSIVGISCSALAILIAILASVLFMSSGSTSSNGDSSGKTDSDTKEETIIDMIQGDSKEKFISECEDFNYKDLARDPNGNMGKKIKLEVKVQQILTQGKETYYRVNMNDEYGFWSGGEFIMRDKRKDDDMKILVDDILMVYAEFDGTEKMLRAFTETEEEIPSIRAYYVELLDEDDYTYDFTGGSTENTLSEEVLNDGTIDTDFGKFTLKYTGYELSEDYEGKQCVIIYFDYTNNSEENSCYSWTANVQVFQNGVECGDAFILDDNNKALNNDMTEVKTGVTISVASAFYIDGLDDIELECGVLYGGSVDTMTIQLQ